MNLTKYEIQVLKLIFKNNLSLSNWTQFLESYELVGYEYTGAGYYLKIHIDNFNFEKETISKPLVIGLTNDIEIGFLIFIEKNKIVLECHSFGEKNLPKNIRDLEVKIKINNRD